MLYNQSRHLTFGTRSKIDEGPHCYLKTMYRDKAVFQLIQYVSMEYCCN